MKVAVLAPINNSPYALLVSQACVDEPGIELVAIVVRKILDWERVRSELRRDGVRLAQKIWQKLVLGGDHVVPSDEVGFRQLIQQYDIRYNRLTAFADAHKIPCLVVRDHNDPGVIAQFRCIQPDVVAFTGGGIVREPLLRASGKGILNTHMGILPYYRGMDVVEWTFIEEKHEEPGVGVTLHFMARGIDTGPIALVKRVPLRQGDSMELLRKRFEPYMFIAMRDGIRAMRDGRLDLRPQADWEGHQYFVMHPRLCEVARKRLRMINPLELD